MPSAFRSFPSRPALESALARIAIERAPTRTADNRPRNPLICLQCQWHAFSTGARRPAKFSLRLHRTRDVNRAIRHFSQAKALRQQQQQQQQQQDREAASPASDTSLPGASSLPSQAESRKWASTQRLNSTMDALLSRVALASHTLNKYTGTDYSGIAALRHDISAQEALVKTRHEVVLGAKAGLDAAQAQQMGSQKEVVALLERKNNWANDDLERYMRLVRSEHVNEQAVQAAREALGAAERALEEARARLERRERERYHEEQIWSDTIRRNSTWITFGLMGFNALLLLLNIGVVEPWRRRRMVGEIKGAISAEVVRADAGALPTAVAGAEEQEEVEGIAAPAPERVGREEALAVAGAADDFVGGAVASEALEGQADEELDAAARTALLAATGPPAERRQSPASPWVQRTWGAANDLFSERLVSVRKLDMTMLALEGVAVGASVAALVAVRFLKPQ